MTKRETMIAYLKLKVEEQDWHGVADAAMDLREIDAEDRGRQAVYAQCTDECLANEEA